MDQDLLNINEATYQPLADRLRPSILPEFFGQTHLIGKNKPLSLAIESGHAHSMIFWGPPGTGKTTLAKLAANYFKARFITLSAVLSGVKDIRAAIEQTKAQSEQTILFVDEVHRFNKAQQDAFLPHIEDGTITFIGATTENPSFELNNALLSRARVYVLKALTQDDLMQIIHRALSDEEKGLGHWDWDFPMELQQLLARVADGDARRVLNIVEILADLAPRQNKTILVDETLLNEVLSNGQNRRFDKGGEVFYDQISALHKAVRGSSPDAALYWMCRMLDGGCDALYIARRVVRMASEDIGNADPRALQLSINAWDTIERLGSPEGELALAQAVVYMASVPKSNAVYNAYNQAMADARNSGSLEVPLHLRNAPTKLMKQLDYGKKYRYAHDEPHHYAAGENYMPEALQHKKYYHPTKQGLEKNIEERLRFLRQLDQQYAIQERNKRKATGDV
ncbi:MAG: replication-associated recombination protein A [Gammaproteobacteria bacterium]|nr:replication-associated recombination protein A [Gammaproteobacteria bacterium]